MTDRRLTRLILVAAVIAVLLFCGGFAAVHIATSGTTAYP